MPDNNKTMPVKTASLFLEQLRQETKEMHEKLEGTSLSKQLLSESVSLQSYTLYLSAMREVIRFSEDNIFPKLANIFSEIETRKKLPLISHDLVVLNDKNQLPEYRPFDNDRSTAFLVGFMYVIEGSALGGRVILKHLNKRLGIDEKTGGLFFAGYGAETGQKWSSFLQDLNQYAEKASHEELITGAKTAFSSIHEYFEKVQV